MTLPLPTIWAFGLVLFRTAGLCVTAPVLSARGVPMRIRAGLAMAVALDAGQRWPAFWRRWAQVAGCAALVSAGSALVFPRSWIAFGVVKDPLGVTTAFSRLASLFAEPLIGPEAVAKNSYWKSMPLTWDYGVWFLVGLPLGAFIAAVISGTFRLEFVPEVWRQQFGGSVLKRFIAAFFGGAIIMFGARMAGGCTSGHGISGGLQLALLSLEVGPHVVQL